MSIVNDIEEYLNNENLFGEDYNLDGEWHPDNEIPGKRFITFNGDLDILYLTPVITLPVYGNVSDIFKIGIRYEHEVIDYKNDPINAHTIIVVKIGEIVIKMDIRYDRGDFDYELEYGDFDKKELIDLEFVPLSDIRNSKIDNILGLTPSISKV